MPFYQDNQEDVKWKTDGKTLVSFATGGYKLFVAMSQTNICLIPKKKKLSKSKTLALSAP